MLWWNRNEGERGRVMKKRVTLLVGSLALLLCIGIGVAVAADWRAKSDEVPQGGAEQITETVQQPAEDALEVRGENGRLVLAELKLPQIAAQDVTLEEMKKVVQLGYRIYESNDIVVLSDREIKTDQICAKGEIDKITYEDYMKYRKDVSAIMKELMIKVLPADTYVHTDDFYDANTYFSGILYGGDFFFLDWEESGYDNARDWFRDWFFDLKPDVLVIGESRSVKIDFSGDIKYYGDDKKYVHIFPSEEDGEIAAKLYQIKETERQQGEADFLGMTLEEYREFLESGMTINEFLDFQRFKESGMTEEEFELYGWTGLTKEELIQYEDYAEELTLGEFYWFLQSGLTLEEYQQKQQEAEK